MRALRTSLLVAFSGFAVLVGPSAFGASKLKTLYSFCSVSNCDDGADPGAALLRDGSGNLYGTAQIGDNGRAFELVFDSATGKYKYKILYRFCRLANCTDGAQPVSNLIMDVNGNLYGTTTLGGAFNGGTVFELRRKDRNYSIKILYSFCRQASCTDGKSPYEGLAYQGVENGELYDGSSPLYGTTLFGGLATNAVGVAYQLVIPTGTTKRKFKVIHTFCSETNCADGAYPWGLIIDAAGNLYGNAEEGGILTAGVAYELSPKKGGFSETVLYNFCSLTTCADGSFPSGVPAIDGSGNIFGTTQSGGTGSGNGGGGTVWEIVPNGKNSQLTTLYNFCSQSNCTDGNEPRAGVAVAPDGDVFGTTQSGGQFCCGIVFQIHTGSENLLYSFCQDMADNCPDGSSPYGGVILDDSGTVYGTTQVGGTGIESAGTVFKLTP